MSNTPEEETNQPVLGSMDEIKFKTEASSVSLEDSSSSTARPALSEVDVSVSNQTSAGSSSNKWIEFSNLSLNDKTKVTTPSEMTSYSSPDSDFFSESKPRARKITLDAVSYIKTTKPNSKFEDIRSEAFDSWNEGIDLELNTADELKKKPKTWLSENEFFSSGPSSSLLPHEEKVSPKLSTSEQEAVPHDNDESDESFMGGIPYGIPQTAMMPSPYMQMSPYIARESSRIEKEYILYFYQIVHDQYNINLLSSFQKKLDNIFKNYLCHFSPRTFSFLLKALVPLMKFEDSINEAEAAPLILTYWQKFLFYVERHLHIFCKLPDDLLSLIQVCYFLRKYNSNIYMKLLVTDIVKVYESLKDLCSVEENEEYIANLELLITISDESSLSSGDSDKSFPSVPSSAKELVLEAIYEPDILSSYENENEVHIANKVHNPWPDVDLTQYMLAHFMMMREELLRPMKNTINDLFSGKSFQSVEAPRGCAVFEHATPKSTTMLASSSETAIVFQLNPVQAQDNIMDSFKEGSFVIILPQFKLEMNPYDQSHLIKKVAKGAMMGQAIRALSHQSTRLASIQVFKEDIARISWSSQYTIIISDVNVSSMLSTLNWLRQEYIDLKKQNFSSILTPRILAANNKLSDNQLNSWDTQNAEQNAMANQNHVPFYLEKTEIDVKCLMANDRLNYRARPGENIWPKHPDGYKNIPAHRLPKLYSISPSQLSAVKFALSHRISVISGASGTGKTYVAAKLALLMSQALHIRQFHDPLLIITKTQSCLDSILSEVVTSIPDVVRFGGQVRDPTLFEKHATELIEHSPADPNYSQYQHLERKLCENQAKLNALFIARFQAQEHDPAVMYTLISHEYLEYMQRGYMDQNKQLYSPEDVVLWNEWTFNDIKSKNFSKAVSERGEFEVAVYLLENFYLHRTGRGLMPIMNTTYLRNQFNSVAQNPESILPISESTPWPFKSSKRSGRELIYKIEHAWKKLPKENVWYVSDEEKAELIHALSQIMVTSIDYEIQEIIKEQMKLGEELDKHLTKKLFSLCGFNRVIGMTADFAAAHREWVSTLWPRAVIVDEASEILESTLSSIVLGPVTEHLVLLGNNDNAFKPKLNNIELAGHPRNLDVSLFKRWKESSSKMVLLEEQWRMCSEISDVIDQFNNAKKESDALLITAPLASCNENMVDGSKPQEEILYGITQRAFYLDFQATENTNREDYYSDRTEYDYTQAEVDEARFIAFFAVYLSQQAHPKPSITILTVCLSQKYLIKDILREEVRERTLFTSNISKINVDTVEENGGQQSSFTIISTATPSHSFSTFNNISSALSQAKYGLFVIGKGTDNVDNRWEDFAKYMKSRDLFGTELQLACFEHDEIFSVSKYQDFDQMPDGGCSKNCMYLVEGGYLCPYKCHFLNLRHDGISNTQGNNF